MEEVVEYLQQIKEEVKGVEMVPLTAALQAIQVASSLNLLESLDQTTAELYKSLSEQTPLEDLGIEE